MNRLRRLRKANNLSQAELASIIGVAQNTISQWETGTRELDYDSLKKLSEYFCITIDFLLDNVVNDSKIEEAFRTEEAFLKKVPIFEKVTPYLKEIELMEGTKYQMANVKEPNDYFYLIIEDDSMYPGIDKGDLALVKKQKTINNGEIAVLLDKKNKGYIRKYICDKQSIILQAFNSKYAPIVYKNDSTCQFTIIGRVVKTEKKW